MYQKHWRVMGMILMLKKYCLLLLLFPALAFSNDGPEAPDYITSIGIAEKITEHYLDYSHYSVIGACQWLHCKTGICVTSTTLELDEYLPDLVVTSYNGDGNDPWLEAQETYDTASYATADIATIEMTGQTLTNGRTRMKARAMHEDRQIIKSVDVIGSPSNLLHFPFPTLELDTDAFFPYFQSDLDALSDRSGLAEGIRWETYAPVNTIGPIYSHWGYEFPRSMTEKTSNDYKAAVMAALHAADIVTNKNSLHVVESTSDSCGKNCAVANVIEEMDSDEDDDDQHEIWQEVFPNDKHIELGEIDDMVGDLGADDDAAGNGNYVFVVWRHYKGCKQSAGHIIYKTVTVPDTEKR